MCFGDTDTNCRWPNWTRSRWSVSSIRCRKMRVDGLHSRQLMLRYDKTKRDAIWITVQQANGCSSSTSQLFSWFTSVLMAKCHNNITDWLPYSLQQTSSELWWLCRDHNRFTALFPGPPMWAGVRRELLDFGVQGKINRGRHTDHLAGCRSIWPNQCPLPPSPHFCTSRIPFLPPNEQCQSTEGTDCTENKREIIRTVLCCVVYDSCAQWYAHTCASSS